MSDGSPRPPPRSAFHNPSVEQFLAVTHALAAELTPWVFERLGRNKNGRLPGGALMEGTSKVTGERFDMDAILVATLEEACLAYCFGLTSFVATVHNNNWAKTPAAKAVGERFTVVLAEQLTRQDLPGAALPAERRVAVAAARVKELVETGGLVSIGFWEAYYRNVHVDPGGGRRSGAPRSGVEEFRDWLNDPAGRPENPLSLLEAKLAERVGDTFKVPDWKADLEKRYGEITRQLLRIAMRLLAAKATEIQAATMARVETAAPSATAPGMSRTQSGPRVLKEWFLAMNMSFLVDDEISDALGQSVANEALWLLGSVLQGMGGDEICAAHPHENQFAARHLDKGLLEDTAGALAEVASKIGVFCSRRDGEGTLQAGLDFKFATGTSYTEADRASLRAGRRGRLGVFKAEEFASALSSTRGAGYLLLDGEVLAAERNRADRMKSVPVTGGVVEPDHMWWSNAEALLAAAAENGGYFATAVAIVGSAAESSLARRRADRIDEPTPFAKSGTTISNPDGSTRSFAKHATVYDQYKGTRSIAELPRAEQDRLILAVFDVAADFRKLVVQQQVLKAQAEGLWGLVVFVGLELERRAVIRNFDQRTDAENRQIAQFFAGTLLGARLEAAFQSRRTDFDYDWSELEGRSLSDLDVVLDQSLDVVRDKLRAVLAPASPEASTAAPTTARRPVSAEDAYVANIARYAITRDDMQPLAMIAAFAWKHGGFEPARAVEYAMQTIHLSRCGGPAEMKDAKTTWESAIRWSMNAGTASIPWGAECIVLAREGLAAVPGEASSPMGKRTLN